MAESELIWACVEESGVEDEIDIASSHPSDSLLVAGSSIYAAYEKYLVSIGEIDPEYDTVSIRRKRKRPQKQAFSFVLLVVALSVIAAAWKLSCRASLSYHVYLIQTHQSSNNQSVEIINVDSERVSTDDLIGLITRADDQNSDDNSALESRALVIHCPQSIRYSELNDHIFEPGSTTIVLPPDVDRHIAQVHQEIQDNTDPAIAGAVIISLYRNTARRLSSSNHLFISRLLSEISGSAIEQEPIESIPISVNNPLPSTADMENENLAAGDVEVEIPLANEPNTESPAAGNTPERTGSPRSYNEVGIKLKFLDDTEKVVKAELCSTVFDFKKTHFGSHVSAGKVIRLIFKGQLLRDDSRTLDSYGLHDQCVLHCHISAHPYSQSPTSSSSPVNNATGNSVPNYGFDQIPARPVFTEVPNESMAMRMLRIGVYYADLAPFMLFYAFTAAISWIQATDGLEDEANAPWYRRRVNQMRRMLYNVMGIFIDFSAPANPNVDDMFSNRFNLGVLFTLLFTVKFMSLWLIVIYFPQYTDTKGVFMLLMLTIFFGLYTFNNRPRQINVANIATGAH